MSRQPGPFYSRLYLWVHLFPPYVLAALFYGIAWLINPFGPAGLGSPYDFFLLVLLLISDAEQWLGWFGYGLSGIGRRRIEPTDSDRETYQQAVALLNERAQQSPDALTSPLTPLPLVLLDLGAVPYLAVGGRLEPQLWISRHALTALDPAALVPLLAHEYGHAEQLRRSGCNLVPLNWWLAFPLAWWLGTISPPLIIAAALLHALLGIRLGYHQRLKAEYHADRWAADRVGREDYARALAAYHWSVAGARRPGVLKQRLVKLGLDAAEITQLTEPPVDQAGS